MLISSRGQYAIRILLDLAIHENGEAINVKTIAERQELSEKYMEQILSVLQKAGFVISTSIMVDIIFPEDPKTIR